MVEGKAEELAAKDATVARDLRCARQCEQKLAEGKRQVTEEKRKSRIGGVVNQFAMVAAQELVVEAEECFKKRGPKDNKPAPKCSAAIVAKVNACMSGPILTLDVRCKAYQLEAAELGLKAAAR